MRRLALLISLVASCIPTDEAPSQTFRTSALAIPNRYIVVLDDSVTDVAALANEHAAVYGGQIDRTYQNALKGYSIELPEQAAIALSHHARVAYVEEDSVVQIASSQPNPPNWGLDRIDQRSLPLDANYGYDRTGAGTNVYIIDTGIRVTHSNFGGRARIGVDTVGDGQNGNDCNGHGTHVAGIVGSSSYGVAKGANLIAVRVLNCHGSGSTSGVIAGIDWITANHVKPAVANASFFSNTSSSINDAVQRAVTAGVTVVAASGNTASDACGTSPASAPAALTVGATSNFDHEASFSNWGSCVDLLAPGEAITSTWASSDLASNTISGTSMAAPHVAGAAALHLGANPAATPAQVEQALEGNATKNAIGSMTSTLTPNLLVYTRSSGPISSFIGKCDGAQCTFADKSSDANGTIVAWQWFFGDGSTSTERNPLHTYTTSGTYTVDLVVTDNEGLTGVSKQAFTVTVPAFVLTAAGRRIKGVKRVDLTWSGSLSSSVDLYRDNVLLGSMPNDGSHAESLGTGNGGSYTYRLCETGGTRCSNDANVVF